MSSPTTSNEKQHALPGYEGNGTGVSDAKTAHLANNNEKGTTAEPAAIPSEKLATTEPAGGSGITAGTGTETAVVPEETAETHPANGTTSPPSRTLSKEEKLHQHAVGTFAGGAVMAVRVVSLSLSYCAY